MTLAAATAEQVSVLTSVNLAAGQCMLGKLSDRFCSIQLRALRRFCQPDTAVSKGGQAGDLLSKLQ